MFSDPHTSPGPLAVGASLDSIAFSWDVVVVGAGVSGATAARLFARAGHRVLLVERSEFPRYKVCGSCLNLRAATFLSLGGIDTRLQAQGAMSLREARIAIAGKSATIPLPGGFAVSRALLDSTLVHAACEDGVCFLPRTTATLGACSARGRSLCLTRGAEQYAIEGRLVIAADGLHGGLLQRAGESEMRVSSTSHIGLGCISMTGGPGYEPGTIYMCCGTSGYVGVVCIEGGGLAVAAAVDPDALRSAESPGQLLAGWIQEAGLPPLPSIASAAWKGTAPLTRQASRFSAERVLALGDARGYVEPFTGEGMAWALESAHQAASLAANALDQCGRGLEERWQVLAQRQMRERPLWCRAVARTLRSPGATRAIVSMLDFFPGLASPIVARMNTDTRS